ncbi:MAG TPA: hypothetical protein VFF79_13365 [Conexibacter sp.]|jgi:hypothetical protein|nr:hypothetical protein [Conexibacter sp.]
MAEANDLRSLLGRALAALTPHPHRGDLIAAGAVPLALGVLLVNARLDATWGKGIFLVINALACVLVLGMGLLAPLEGERPRSYQQVLLFAGELLGFVTLLRLAQVLGADAPLSAAGSRLWIFAVVTLSAAWIARTRRSAFCALIAAVAGIVVVLSFVDWAFSPKGPATARWLLLVLAIALVLAALARRDGQRRESVYLIDAAGVAILLLGLTFVGALFRILTLVGAPGGLPGGGWKLVLLAAGLGLVAYAGVDREPGPGYLGTLILLLFVGLVGIPSATGASLWFWPLVLLVLGGVAVGAGLRPREELPPEPPGAGPDPPTEPFPGPGSGSSGRPSGSLWASPPPGGDELS